jgi:hypothetical protein
VLPRKDIALVLSDTSIENGGVKNIDDVPMIETIILLDYTFTLFLRYGYQGC